MTASLFFHLGAHKTATTLVQLRLRDRKRQLRRRGVRLIEPGDLRGSALMAYVAGGRRADFTAATGELHRLLGEVRGGTAMAVYEDLIGKIRLTSLYPDARERLERFGECLDEAAPDTQFRPTLVIRRFDRYWASCYRHLVKTGHLEDFAESLERLRHVDGRWHLVVEAVEAVVGHPVPVRRYEDLCGLEADEFMRAVVGMWERLDDSFWGRQPTSLSSLRRELRSWVDTNAKLLGQNPNPAFSERGILLAQSIRPLVSDDEWRRLFRPLLSRHFSRKHEPDTGMFRIPDDVRQPFIDAYEEDAAWLGGRLRLSYADDTAG
jgi:hypothetical protein